MVVALRVFGTTAGACSPYRRPVAPRGAAMALARFDSFESSKMTCPRVPHAGSIATVQPTFARVARVLAVARRVRRVGDELATGRCNGAGPRRQAAGGNQPRQSSPRAKGR